MLVYVDVPHYLSNARELTYWALELTHSIVAAIWLMIFITLKQK
tara:strand:- start:10797 stop:10928 length:132 start_codon:yes stop_codon:yes gene_type:complete